MVEVGFGTVYLLHFSDGCHYIGATSVGVSSRLRRHLSGFGSRFVYRKIQAVGLTGIGYTLHFSSFAAALRAEKRYKKNRRAFYKYCCYCGVCSDG